MEQRQGQDISPPAPGPDALLHVRLPTYWHTYTERDVALYALGIGCGPEDLRYVYEGHARFAPLPTFFTVPAHPAVYGVPLPAYVPGCDPLKVTPLAIEVSSAMKDGRKALKKDGLGMYEHVMYIMRGLHAEQYLELPLERPPAAADVATEVSVVDVQDKGKGAVVVVRTVTTDVRLGHVVAVNEFTSFMLGTRPFKGVANPVPRSAAATAPNKPPSRPPDAVAEVPTMSSQAALYRLSGDLNPLHIDPAAAAHVGFGRPILHGLCTMGASVAAVLREYGGGDPAAVQSVKVRFSKHVFPGDTLQVAMWAEEVVGAVLFETRVAGRGGTAISNAAVVFRPGRMLRRGGGCGGGSGGGGGAVPSKL